MKKFSKGIILAGGSGSRLYPLTKSCNKHLLPIYNKPMIYYPLSTLLQAGIHDILIISSDEYIKDFIRLFGDGSSLGIKISYKVQENPNGIAEAFLIGEDFIGESNVCLILGDNVFYGSELENYLNNASINMSGCSVFSYHVSNPSDYGVVEFNENKVISIEEKPKIPKSNYALTGMYFCDNRCVEYAKSIEPSERGELEIVDVLKKYLDNDSLEVFSMKKGFVWLDTGLPMNLLEASNFIKTIEDREGINIGCIEEISLNKGFIDKDQYDKLISSMPSSAYKKRVDFNDGNY